MRQQIDPIDLQNDWRPVVGFEGRYVVSRYSQLASVPRIDPLGRKVPGGIMKPIMNKGYPRYTLVKEGRYFYRFAHKMVAEAFIGSCPVGQEVRHNDDDRTNARLDNLVYGTRADNIADCKRNGGFRNGASHLTEAMVRVIASRHDDSAFDLAIEFGVSHQTIGGIRNRQTWKHLNLDLRPSYRRYGADHPMRKKALARKAGASLNP